MEAATMEKLNATNDPNNFGGKCVADVNSDGAELWQFGTMFATRWHQKSDGLPSTWNGFGIQYEKQIPLA